MNEQQPKVADAPFFRAKDFIRLMLIFTAFMGMHMILYVSNPSFGLKSGLVVELLIGFAFPLIGYYFVLLKLPKLKEQKPFARHLIAFALAFLFLFPSQFILAIYSFIFVGGSP